MEKAIIGSFDIRRYHNLRNWRYCSTWIPQQFISMWLLN